MSAGQYLAIGIGLGLAGFFGAIGMFILAERHARRQTAKLKRDMER